MFDSHAHLNHERYQADRHEVLARARAAGVSEIVNVGYDAGSSAVAVMLAEQEEGLYAAVGLHPHDTSGLNEEIAATLRGLAQRPQVVAIGETGLDFYRNLSPRQAQREAFEWHIALAAELGKTLIVHDRDAHEEVMEVLTAAPPQLRVVLHCFSGGPALMEEAVARGCWIGIAGNVTYRRAETLREVAARVPMDRLLVETDCPYLTPQPYRKRPRNEPAFLAATIEVIAAARGQALEDIAEATQANARRAFGLDAPPAVP